MLDQALRDAALRRLLPRPAELRRVRRQAGIPTAAVASDLGVTETAVRRYEGGSRTPRDPKVVAAYLEILRRMRRGG